MSIFEEIKKNREEQRHIKNLLREESHHLF